VLPLAGTFRTEASETLGDRTRAALEREKALALRSIKELEFDRGMGKVSEKDFAEMSARLRLRAARLMSELDAGSLYRQQIEKEIAQRLEKTGPTNAAAANDVGRTLSGPPGEPEKSRSTNVCAGCAAANDMDAKFCKSCGARLEAAS
jgi:hypothetical protein